ncbi:hypothetical protein [Deinococcus hohokamensis]|uniref:Uncharacterized protein n=1 Tax=Deinococcus hohokamensis TaxID=309883 RepID=A0ABV9I4A4_9DEIO
MKALELQLPDGTPAPATDFGNVRPGTTTASREVRLVNVGDEPITDVLNLRVVQNETVAGEYRVTTGGVALTGEWQDVLAAQGGSLAPGAFVALQEAWHVPAGVTDIGADTGFLDWQYLR